VQLSKHDLAQLDAAALAALTPEQLHALSVKLLADLKLAHARLDRNPRNSSRPPSSMAPWDRAGDDADEPASPAPDDAPADERDRHAEPDAAAAPAGDEASAAQPPQGEPAGDTREQRRPGQRPGAPAMAACSDCPSITSSRITPRTARAAVRRSRRGIPGAACTPIL
jgi:hypothetical protein